MTDIQPVCVVHRPAAGKSDEALKEFTEQSWSSVKKAERLRKEQLKTSKFFDIIIPDVPYMCYHSSCYKNSTTVRKHVNKSVSDVVAKCTSTLRSCVDHPCSNSTGVFEQLCFFCGETRKWNIGKFEKLGTIETKSAGDKIVGAATNLNDDVFFIKNSWTRSYCKGSEIPPLLQKYLL